MARPHIYHFITKRKATLRPNSLGFRWKFHTSLLAIEIETLGNARKCYKKSINFALCTHTQRTLEAESICWRSGMEQVLMVLAGHKVDNEMKTHVRTIILNHHHQHPLYVAHPLCTALISFCSSSVGGDTILVLAFFLPRMLTFAREEPIESRFRVQTSLAFDYLLTQKFASLPPICLNRILERRKLGRVFVALITELIRITLSAFGS